MEIADSSPLDIVIFGGTGDLAWRKLLPALYMAHLHRSLGERHKILGVGRHDWSRKQYVEFVDRMSRRCIDAQDMQPLHWQDFLRRLEYVQLDASQPEGYGVLKEACQPGSTKVFYLATAPSLFTAIAAHLHAAGLVDAQSRVVLEKPLGHDLASARAINESVARQFEERQIYRIDHYLGKETVQNLMVLRFGNAIYEPMWRVPFIRSVQITVAETVGVGTRAGFYDGTGAMRDMVQNHLLQLLCIVAMEPPISLDADDVRDEKLKVLRSLRKLGPSDLRHDTVRGQYTAGTVDGQAVPGYQQEEGVPAGSRTETFVAIRAHIDNARWAGIPFFLRTGKRMPKRQSEVIVEFSQPPFSIFDGLSGGPQPNRLLITLQPEESIKLQMMAKEPGSGMRMRPVYLDLDLQSAFTERRAEAYERLLIDVVKGRLTHFMRRDELEAAWKWADPILDGWASLGDLPKPYAAGNWGPPAASALVARENALWSEAQ
jgi:glucose-6-phosphate 1-dehydrogenase